MNRLLFLVVVFVGGLAMQKHVQALSADVTVRVHIKAVSECKISLLGRKDSRLFKPLQEIQTVMKGEDTVILVPGELLPGEFVLRFDYQEKPGNNPYPSEKFFFVNDQDLELWVNPVYCNNPDSTWFQKDERENSAFTRFSEENGKKKEKIFLLQNFLMNYDDTDSKLYKEAILEYQKRRNEYNKWLIARIEEDQRLFVSRQYRYEYIPDILMRGSESDRVRSLIAHYFDGMDFSDSLIIRTSDIIKWMDGYVNLYGQLSTTVALRDSLLPLAGTTAIERARKGHPKVYGWMVDYFYNGFESNGISSGMLILEPYLNDPGCLTSKRMEINKRLKGIQTLTPGSKAPEIRLKDPNENPFVLSSFLTQNRYMLLLFWSAGCSHCRELLEQIYPWYLKQPAPDIEVFAISLDDNENDIKAWHEKILTLNGWRHFNDPQGVMSKVANDYYILSTPMMFLLDGKTKEILAVPNTFSELTSFPGL